VNLSRIAVLLAPATAVLVAVASAQAGWAAADALTPMIYADPLGFGAQFIDNPRFVLSIFDNPFD
jgi:hypothetical protein